MIYFYFPSSIPSPNQSLLLIKINKYIKMCFLFCDNNHLFEQDLIIHQILISFKLILIIILIMKNVLYIWVKGPSNQGERKKIK